MTNIDHESIKYFAVLLAILSTNNALGATLAVEKNSEHTKTELSETTIELDLSHETTIKQLAASKKPNFPPGLLENEKICLKNQNKSKFFSGHCQIQEIIEPRSAIAVLIVGGLAILLLNKKESKNLE